MVIFDIILLIIFAIIARQDFKMREVHGYLFAIAFAAIVVKALWVLNVEELLRNFSLNLLFVVVQLSVLVAFYSIKNKKFTNIINKYLGAGDLLFLVLLSAGFSPLIFGCFLVGSFIIIAIIFYVVTIFKKSEIISTIPLAGGLALSYILLMVAGMFFNNINFYNDLPLGDLIIG